MSEPDLAARYATAAHAIRSARALFIGAGAGMGVDSGLPDFRGDEGFWNAYPPFREQGLSFVDLADPSWFAHDPTLAWGFYGHRASLYRETAPHAGFEVLHEWTRARRRGSWVFTSNVDGQFQKAGLDKITECHGSIHHLQCTKPCSPRIWAVETVPEVDPETFRANDPLPVCPDCGSLSRPNILMFGDGAWHADRSWAQQRRMNQWIAEQEGQPIVVIEIGAGGAIPTVRMQCQRVARQFGAKLVRINPRESDGPPGMTISLPVGAKEALEAIQNSPG